jgi:alanine-glyoxylate transaminase/serine-glyoxylate transaminase/serine-pyruvate transaminase
MDHNAMTIVDTVTSLGGVPVGVDVWGADAVYSGSQKCLSCPPGLSPVTFSDQAVNTILNRKVPVQSWLLDLSLVAGYWQGDGNSGARTYHHTAPVNALMGLHESLRKIVEEGLEKVWARHKMISDIIVSGMEEMGFSMLVEESIRLPELLTINLPEGVDDNTVRKKLLDEYGIEISAGLGPFAGKLWRIGVMGEGARKENADRILSAIRECIN